MLGAKLLRSIQTLTTSAPNATRNLNSDAAGSLSRAPPLNNGIPASWIGAAITPGAGIDKRGILAHPAATRVPICRFAPP